MDLTLGIAMFVVIAFAGASSVDQLREAARENQAEQASVAAENTNTAPELEPSAATEETADPVDFPWLPALAGTGGVLLLAGAGAGGAHLVRRRRTAATQLADLTARLDQARTAHLAITDSYADMRFDPIAAIDHLALWDVRDPLTATFTHAYVKAGDLAELLKTTTVTDASVGEYFDAVVAARVAWDRAVSHARRLGDTALPTGDRNDLARARKLLTTAANSSATESERALAASRASDILTGLRSIVWPSETMTSIETISRKELSPAHPA